jgi:hypothetical protein
MFNKLFFSEQFETPVSQFQPKHNQNHPPRTSKVPLLIPPLKQTYFCMLFSRKKKETVSVNTSTKTNEITKEKVNVLIIDSAKNAVHWKDLFTDWNQNVPDHPLHYNIDITEWSGIVNVTSYNEYNRKEKKPKLKCICTLKDPQTNACRHFEPHYVIVRKLVCGMKITENYTNTLLAFMYARVPSMNSFHSIYMNIQRPIVHAELTRLRDLHGFDQFPVIDQYMFTDPREILFTPNPIQNPSEKDEKKCQEVVIKVGTAEAGYGKMKLATDSTNIKDFGQTIARYGEFLTVEPFVSHKELDIRVQMIGKDHIRVYERRAANWKGNQGSCVLKEIPVTERFRKWAIWCSELFGGMTILTVDAVGVGDDLYILEINDTASGFARENEMEDRKILCNLCVAEMVKLFSSSQSTEPVA